MATKYTQQQLDQALQDLPEELKQTLFSAETSEKLADVSERHNIYGEKGVLLSKYVGYVLMGLLLPQEFPQVLQKEVKLPNALAQAIARDLNRLVFYPVRPALEQLHKMEIEVSARVVTPQPAEEGQAPTEKPKQEPRGPDTYREPIE